MVDKVFPLPFCTVLYSTRIQVIRKMALSIQPPDPERFKWEHHTVVMEPKRSLFSQAVSIVVPLSEGGPPKPRGSKTNHSDVRRTLCASRHAFEMVDEVITAKFAPDDAGDSDSFWRTVAAAAAEHLVLPLSPDSSCASLLEQVRSCRQNVSISSLVGYRCNQPVYFAPMRLSCRR